MAKSLDYETVIRESEKLNLEENHRYHALLGEGVDVLQDFFFCASIEERNADIVLDAIATQIIVSEISELESRTVNRAARKTKPAAIPMVSAYIPKT